MVYDVRDAQAVYKNATVEWRNSPHADVSIKATLHEYKRAAAFIPELIEEIQRLQTELKGKN